MSVDGSQAANIPLGIKERGKLESKGDQEDGSGSDVGVSGRHGWLVGLDGGADVCL